ncbi:MAG: hypothetical protein ABIQ32_00015 [Sphingomicrobium sp.]
MEFVGPFSHLSMLVAGALQIAATDVPTIAEEDYDFIAVTKGPCALKIGVGIEPKHEAECQRITAPRRFRGTWQVEFEGSFFTPIGKPDCVETRRNCAELVGQSLPWPSRWACPRKFEVEFVGRRNVLPRDDPSAYRIIVDKVITAKRLPDPLHEPGDCDSTAP